MRISLALLLLVASVLAFDAPARAATYRWTDAKGVMHFTDNPDAVPPEHRQGGSPGAAPVPRGDRPSFGMVVGKPPAAQKQDAKAGTESKAASDADGADAGKASESPYEKAAKTPGVELDNFGRDETYWRGRRQFWEKRLEDAQRLHDEARREFYLANQRFDSREYKQMKALRERMRMLEEEIAKAQGMLHGGLEREARKSGAPPGWAR
jgi:hypothetical protein